jgi:hypothetical protein
MSKHPFLHRFLRRSIFAAPGVQPSETRTAETPPRRALPDTIAAPKAAANLLSGQHASETVQLPPHVQIIQMTMAIWGARAIYAAASLGIADLLAHGPGSVDELAQLTGTQARSLYRLLRALASCGVFTEVEPQRFALTPLGAALRTDAPGSARAAVMTIGGDWQWKAWGHLLDSVRTGKPGMAKAHGVGLFGYLAAHPADSAQFNDAMVGMYAAVAPAVTAAYDFSRFRTVVDVGGGTGLLLSTILRATEGLAGILFELPEPATQARRAIGELGLSARCQVVEGDFFKTMPAGHDGYILSHVLHDWTDEEALLILRNCRRAVAKEGKLLIIEAIVPPGDAPHHSKLIDLLMLTVTGGVERSADEFAALLAAANFRLSRVLPTATHQSIVEAIPT